jgi:hypothetical protein
VVWAILALALLYGLEGCFRREHLRGLFEWSDRDPKLQLLCLSIVQAKGRYQKTHRDALRLISGLHRSAQE